MWEEAIILGKELAEQYENEMFDFEQLSASLVSKIIINVENAFRPVFAKVECCMIKTTNLNIRCFKVDKKAAIRLNMWHKTVHKIRILNIIVK